MERRENSLAPCEDEDAARGRLPERRGKPGRYVAHVTECRVSGSAHCPPTV